MCFFCCLRAILHAGAASSQLQQVAGLEVQMLMRQMLLKAVKQIALTMKQALLMQRMGGKTRVMLQETATVQQMMMSSTAVQVQPEKQGGEAATSAAEAAARGSCLLCS
jgi:hypothetical protein